MTLDPKNFYHPFQKPSLEFLLNNSSFSDFEVVNEIDLYHQPLENPSVVLTFFVIKLVVICVGESICIKLLDSLKKETGLLTDVTRLFIIVQMILHPTFHFFETVINTVYPVNELIGDWMCFLVWLFWGVMGRILLSNSFISALMRYLFIVHEQKVEFYGKERVKRWFLYVTIASSIVQFALHALKGSPRLSFVNKCYGNDHRVFLFQTSTFDMSSRQSINFYGPHANMSFIREVFASIGKIVEVIWFLLAGLNVAEAILYFKIHKKLSR